MQSIGEDEDHCSGSEAEGDSLQREMARAMRRGSGEAPLESMNKFKEVRQNAVNDHVADEAAKEQALADTARLHRALRRSSGDATIPSDFFTGRHLQDLSMTQYKGGSPSGSPSSSPTRKSPNRGRTRSPSKMLSLDEYRTGSPIGRRESSDFGGRRGSSEFVSPLPKPRAIFHKPSRGNRRVSTMHTISAAASFDSDDPAPPPVVVRRKMSVHQGADLGMYRLNRFFNMCSGIANRHYLRAFNKLKDNAIFEAHVQFKAEARSVLARTAAEHRGHEEISSLTLWAREVCPDIFTNFDDTLLKECVQHTEMLTYKAGDTVFCEGDVGNHYMIVFSGAVDILAHGPQGKAREPDASALGDVVFTFKEGSGFGELAMLEESHTRSASAVAQTDCAILRFHRTLYQRTFGVNQGQCARGEILRFLRGTWFYSDWSRSRLMTLANNLRKKTYRRGDVILKFGQESPGIYLIQQGEVKLNWKNSNKSGCATPDIGDGVELCILHSGDLIGGDLALLEDKDKKRRNKIPAEVVAASTEVVLLMLPLSGLKGFNTAAKYSLTLQKMQQHDDDRAVLMQQRFRKTRKVHRKLKQVFNWTSNRPLTAPAPSGGRAGLSRKVSVLGAPTADLGSFGQARSISASWEVGNTSANSQKDAPLPSLRRQPVVRPMPGMTMDTVNPHKRVIRARALQARLGSAADLLGSSLEARSGVVVPVPDLLGSTGVGFSFRERAMPPN
jgi:CRP-like cAMP-binding protein